MSKDRYRGEGGRGGSVVKRPSQSEGLNSGWKRGALSDRVGGGREKIPKAGGGRKEQRKALRGGKRPVSDAGEAKGTSGLRNSIDRDTSRRGSSGRWCLDSPYNGGNTRRCRRSRRYFDLNLQTCLVSFRKTDRDPDSSETKRSLGRQTRSRISRGPDNVPI